MTMPETAVHENNFVVPGQNNVGITGQFANM